MIYVLIAILCSVTVSINFKLLKRYYTNAYQAIVFNYPTAAILCIVFFKPDMGQNPSLTNWTTFAFIALMLISIFYFISKSIATSGIVLTAIAQRLSLIIPVLASFLFFGESLNSIKIIGLLVGFGAIYASRPEGKFDYKNMELWYPIIVFLGTGIIDVFFNVITKLDGISFITALVYIFLIASIMGFLSLFYLKINNQLDFQLKAALAGVVLGILNFGSIYFYIKALDIENQRPSVIYSMLDIGVIALGSLAGFVLFKEKITKLNIIGLCLAITAIVILTFA